MSAQSVPSWITRWSEVMVEAHPNGRPVKGPSPFYVIDTVCDVYRVTARAIFGHSRNEPLSTARLLAMVLVSNHFGFSTSETGRLFARDESAVSHARRRIADLYSSSKEDRDRFEEVCRKAGLHTIAIGHQRSIHNNYRNAGGQTLQVNLRDLDPLDTHLVLAVLQAVTNPVLAETRTKLRSGKLALTSDGFGAQWVEPAHS